MEVTNKLWILIASEQHEDDIMKCIIEHPSYCSSAIDDELPIHRAIKDRLSMDVIRMMLLCYPECCMMRYEGNVLLHHMLNIPKKMFNTGTRHDIDEYLIADDIIINVIDIYSDAVRVENDAGELPILIECNHTSRYDVIIKLVTIYPEALTIACSNGYLPLHSVSYNYHSTIEVVLYLIDQYRDAVLIVYSGNLPIHIECRHRCRYAVIKKLLEIYPESIKCTDACMRYPLHLACMSTDSQTDVVMYLISINYDAVRKKGKYHEYPLHIECKTQCRYEIVMKLLEIYPESISIQIDYFHSFPLHLAITSTAYDSLRVISMLISRYPDPIKIGSGLGYLFMMMFDKYYTEYLDYHIKYHKRYLMSIRGIAVHMLNFYPRALCICKPYGEQTIDPIIQSNPIKYRLLLNLASHQLSVSEHIHDYHDMNYHARSTILHLIYKLSASRMICKHDNLKHVWLWRMMILAESKGNEHEHGVEYDIHVTYGWLKGDDLGQHLLRYVVGYL